MSGADEYKALAVSEMPRIANVPMPSKDARLPCVVCGGDLIYDAPEAKTGRTTEAVNLHTPNQPFVCFRCWHAAEETLHSTMQDGDHPMSATEPTDEESMRMALHQLNASEMRARILLEMARGGYLGNSTRRNTGP